MDSTDDQSVPVSSWFGRVFLAMILGLTLMSCSFPGSTKPVIKIGLIAPFEGEQRPYGYQRLYGVKLALQEVNLSGGVAGYKIELVALNDFGDETETILQAQELVIDSDVRAIIGQWDPQLFRVTAPIYASAHLAVVDPAGISDFSDLPPTFVTDFTALGGSLPNEQAQQAYLATYHLLQAIEKAVVEAGSPVRKNVRQALAGLSIN